MLPLLPDFRACESGQSMIPLVGPKRYSNCCPLNSSNYTDPSYLVMAFSEPAVEMLGLETSSRASVLLLYWPWIVVVLVLWETRNFLIAYYYRRPVCHIRASSNSRYSLLSESAYCCDCRATYNLWPMVYQSTLYIWCSKNHHGGTPQGAFTVFDFFS